MSIGSNLLTKVVGLIKLNDTIDRLSKQTISLESEVREIDRRVLRLEAILDFCQPYLAKKQFESVIRSPD